jgi:hypothetical protein
VLRRYGLIVLMLLPFLAAGAGSAKLADRLAVRLARALDETLGAALRLSAAPKEADEAAVLPAEPVSSRDTGPAPVLAAKPTAATKVAPRRVANRGAERAPERGLRVSAQVVLRLARSGVRPSGTLVKASQACPAGLRLSGVGGLGVGLRDGDILTHAAGRPATSRADVVGAVIGARGARQREVSGRFCRDGEPWNLVVEQPYLDSPAESDGRVASSAARAHENRSP